MRRFLGRLLVGAEVGDAELSALRNGATCMAELRALCAYVRAIPPSALVDEGVPAPLGGFLARGLTTSTDIAATSLRTLFQTALDHESSGKSSDHTALSTQAMDHAEIAEADSLPGHRSCDSSASAPGPSTYDSLSLFYSAATSNSPLKGTPAHVEAQLAVQGAMQLLVLFTITQHHLCHVEFNRRALVFEPGLDITFPYVLTMAFALTGRSDSVAAVNWTFIWSKVVKLVAVIAIMNALRLGWIDVSPHIDAKIFVMEMYRNWLPVYFFFLLLIFRLARIVLWSLGVSPRATAQMAVIVAVLRRAGVLQPKHSLAAMATALCELHGLCGFKNTWKLGSYSPWRLVEHACIFPQLDVWNGTVHGEMLHDFYVAYTVAPWLLSGPSMLPSALTLLPAWRRPRTRSELWHVAQAACCACLYLAAIWTVLCTHPMLPLHKFAHCEPDWPSPAASGILVTPPQPEKLAAKFTGLLGCCGMLENDLLHRGGVLSLLAAHQSSGGLFRAAMAMSACLGVAVTHLITFRRNRRGPGLASDGPSIAEARRSDRICKAVELLRAVLPRVLATAHICLPLFVDLTLERPAEAHGVEAAQAKRPRALSAWSPVDLLTQAASSTGSKAVKHDLVAVQAVAHGLAFIAVKLGCIVCWAAVLPKRRWWGSQLGLTPVFALCFHQSYLVGSSGTTHGTYISSFITWGAQTEALLLPTVAFAAVVIGVLVLWMGVVPGLLAVLWALVAWMYARCKLFALRLLRGGLLAAFQAVGGRQQGRIFGEADSLLGGKCSEAGRDGKVHAADPAQGSPQGSEVHTQHALYSLGWRRRATSAPTPHRVACSAPKIDTHPVCMGLAAAGFCFALSIAALQHTFVGLPDFRLLQTLSAGNSTRGAEPLAATAMSAAEAQETALQFARSYSSDLARACAWVPPAGVPADFVRVGDRWTRPRRHQEQPVHDNPKHGAPQKAPAHATKPVANTTKSRESSQHKPPSRAHTAPVVSARNATKPPDGTANTIKADGAAAPTQVVDITYLPRRLPGLQRVVNICNASEAARARCAERDIYVFGVYAGGSMLHIARYFNQTRVPFRTMWGFDSFMESWQGAGEYSSTRSLGASSVDEALQKLHRKIGDPRVQFVRGFYNVSLTAELASQRMAPASFVDMDCDQSTYEALSGS